MEYEPEYTFFEGVLTRLGDLDACAVIVARRIWLVRVGWLVVESRGLSPCIAYGIVSLLLAWPGFWSCRLTLVQVVDWW